MAFNFTFADNARLGLQIVGADTTGTSQNSVGDKIKVKDADLLSIAEVMYIGEGEGTGFKPGIVSGYYIDADGEAVKKNAAPAPIVGVYISNGNADYIQTGGVAFVQSDSDGLTKEGKCYLVAGSGIVSSTGSGNIEIKGAIAGDPADKIEVDIDGTGTDLYPIYLNNATL